MLSASLYGIIGILRKTEYLFIFRHRNINKLHFAVHGHTAAELIHNRANAERTHMGLTTWFAYPHGKILKSDVSTAKNYLSESELADLGRIVSAYLDLAESRAKRRIPMTMEDWAKRLDIFLQADDRELLQNAGKISAEIAKQHAESEFEKYRVIQDRLFQNDFDMGIQALEQGMIAEVDVTANEDNETNNQTD